MTANPPGARSTREKLVSLFDYVAQVVRLEERTALTLGDYKLADGSLFAVRAADTAALPGVKHDGADEEGPVWLAVERLARSPPPDLPEDLSPWVVVAADPGRGPTIRPSRTIAVDEAGRLARIAAGACAASFEPVATPSEEATPAAEAAPATYRQTLCLADQPSTEAQIAGWVSGAWTAWAAAEGPRRRTIALYERLYRLLQQREAGGAEAPVEVLWGIGLARWSKGGRRLERPLIERAVDIELDEAAGGLLRVRPTVADAIVDLAPYEAMGSAGLGPLDAAIRREIEAAAGEDGVSPFRRASFEPIIALAAARLDADAAYQPAATGADDAAAAGVGGTASLLLDDAWVLFARPRSAHVLLADLDRLKEGARDLTQSLDGLAARIVTEPSAALGEDGWTPLSDTLGGSAAPAAPAEPASLATEVFFPKPFNDDQIEIVRRLARSDGLVVQGPPGTGKTHTIANLICHAMATGQRVLVVSRGEAALAVLREQLPASVRPLAIALLSNERQGLGQVEGAIREIQAVVEASRPDIRHAAIRHCEAAILAARDRLAAIDAELDALAGRQAERIGPRAETPAELARRVAASRPAAAWFTDRPAAYVAETDLAETDLAALVAARRAVGDLLDHRDQTLPAPADLPDAATLAAWHTGLSSSPSAEAAALTIAPAEAEGAAILAAALAALARFDAALPRALDWLRPFLRPGLDEPWPGLLAGLVADSTALAAARADNVLHAVEWPPGLIDDAEARAAIARGARGERPWPVLTIGKGGAKAHLAAVRVRGAPLREGDSASWAAVEARLLVADRERDVGARWHAFAAEAGAPDPVGAGALATIGEALRLNAAAQEAFDAAPRLRERIPALGILAAEPGALERTALALRQAAEAAHHAATQEAVARLRLLFAGSEARAAQMARRFFDTVLGAAAIPPARVATAWDTLGALLGRLHGLADAFATITTQTTRIASAGAPAWADRLRREPAGPDGDPLVPAGWREIWDLGAADAHLGRLEARPRLQALASSRAETERTIERLFLDLVRERTFYALERRLSPSVKSALVTFVRALGRLGKGTGRGAAKQRRTAREAMRRCYAAVPCWIMPSWRVSEQLPADLCAFDLVILDEASQSDVTELPAVLRGRKILVVGDDRQVSPQLPFVPQAKIDALRDKYLRGLPFASLLEPGESLYTLMQAVFPDARLMLKEHFRCVEPIIRFSMGFYPETLIPLRVPAAAERLDPPLIDILVPHGERDKGRKINRAEAGVIVDEIAAIAARPDMARRTIGVISLIGGDQAQHIRALLEERLGAETMQRHAILCGDSATFQGNERDVVFLSMVADGRRRTTLTMPRYEQRFNVAMSRGRDRVVLVRSVSRDSLNPADLKARLIAHFEQPMPAAPAEAGDPLARCESEFEQAVMSALLARGYAVTPQVGALGFRIDLVVDGAGGRRLAVECDGDRFHGPGQWRDDMRRQRVLERVGWRFWRCFASSFYADPDGMMGDLVETLRRAGIEPAAPELAAAGPSPWVEHRIVRPALPAEAEPAETKAPDGDSGPTASPRGAAVGDRLTLSFAETRQTLSVLLTAEEDDWDRRLVAVTTPLGQALLGREEDDEVELPFAAGPRRAVVERIGPA